MLKDIVSEKIECVLKEEVPLLKPKSIAHYATPFAFILAKRERKNPIQIADELAKKLANNTIFSSVSALKGYINFKISPYLLNECTTKALSLEGEFATDTAKEDKILLEFVSANPTGPLHIGHARGAILGDVLLKMGRHLGYDISGEYYVNDDGSQIELLGLSVLLAVKSNILNETFEYPNEYYKGSYIKEMAQEAYKHLGKNIFEYDSSIEKVSIWAKDRMLELIKEDLKSINIEFDNFVSEKSLKNRWVDTLKTLQKNGGVYNKDGKLWLKSSKFKDEKDRVIVREDKRATYLAGDIIYHKDKFQRGFEKCINVWGADHHGYVPRIKASLEFLGYDSNNLEILLSQMVSLLKNGEPYKMSKRAGNFILMQDVVDDIGSDALRFIFTSKKTDTHLEFDVENLKKNDSSNPLYYISYAHARIFTMLHKSGIKMEDIINSSIENLDEDILDIVFKSLSLKDVLIDSFASREVQKLPQYLKELATLYHKFYNEHKILSTKNEKPLLKVSLMVALSIRTGLKILGIKAKETM